MSITDALASVYRTDPAPADWRDCRRSFDERFDANAGRDWPAGLGTNFITPDVLGYVRAGEHVVEVSTGVGFGGGRCFGVTVARAPDAPSHALDRLCDDLDEVAEALDEIGRSTR